MKDFVFLASIEGDLLILAGISSLVKEINPEQKTILILPRYPRVYRRVDDYRQFFDTIIEIGGINFTWKIKGMLRNIIGIARIMKQLIPFHDSIFFLFDIYNLVELTVYSFVKHHKNARLVTVTAFEGDEIDFQNLEKMIKGTLINSIYSILLAGKLFPEYKVKNTDHTGINYFKGECDLQLSIKKSKYRNSYKRIINELPYPPLFLMDKNNNQFDKYKLINSLSVIIFVDTQYSNWTEDYWGKTNRLIDYFEKQGIKVYVKDHPNCVQTDVYLLSSKSIIVLPKEISAEMLFVNNARNIVGVLGHGTTPLITASWLMIPAFDTSKYFAFNANLQKKMSDFLTLGQDINTVNDLSELQAFNFSVRSNIEEPLYMEKQTWKNVVLTDLQKFNDRS